MDLERDELRQRYRLCRIGFALITLGLGLLWIDSALHLVFLLTMNHDLLSLLQSPWWGWLVGAPITWGTLVGAYLLWGRSTDPVWHRRAGLLVIMNGIDLISWTLEHNEELGLRLGPVGHDWLRMQVSKGLSWAEFLLFASMAVEMMTQLGKPRSPEPGTAARSLAMIGLVFWAIVFAAQTDWAHGWPLQPRPVPQQISRETWILTIFGSCLLTTIASLQVTALSASAFVQCGRTLNQMNEEDLSDDLLRSRSETFSDEPKRWFQKDEEDPWR